MFKYKNKDPTRYNKVLTHKKTLNFENLLNKT